MEKTGICKISDFGISKRTDDLNGMASTAMQGTVFWMAPEVIQPQRKGYNSKIDIWSVGCVVLEMWAGKRPWSDDEAITVMFKVRLFMCAALHAADSWICCRYTRISSPRLYLLMWCYPIVQKTSRIDVSRCKFSTFNVLLMCSWMSSDPEERASAAELQLHPYLELPEGWVFNDFK